MVEDFKSLYVFVACESYSGLILSKTQFFLPLHKLSFPFIFSFAVLLTLLMIVFPSIISLGFLVRLKDIIGSPSNVLAIFLFICKIDWCFFMIWETFRTNLFKDIVWGIQVTLLLFWVFWSRIYLGILLACSTFSFMSSELYRQSTNFLVLMFGWMESFSLGKVDVQICYVNSFVSQSLS